MKEDTHMDFDLVFPSTPVRKPNGRSFAKNVSSFGRYAIEAECSLLGRLHKVISLSLLCFNTWLRPSKSDSKGEPLSAIQEQDPYLERLLIALRALK